MSDAPQRVPGWPYATDESLKELTAEEKVRFREVEHSAIVGYADTADAINRTFGLDKKQFTDACIKIRHRNDRFLQTMRELRTAPGQTQRIELLDAMMESAIKVTQHQQVTLESFLKLLHEVSIVKAKPSGCLGLMLMFAAVVAWACS